ncbi:hypothetical protein EO244_00425 [Ancylomarina salipaludis]|uniref:Haemolysin activator HlyB C-terminal domain-containing protein n=1 Tax=Ancylomarina salipaludis TaxID=2501299 RepID=A0A4Q1JQB0_9BACT|nr:ShlB/FhaC/HecB family hemolysin secretion/activation protein [Ancylomarina salipaludis]RXQ97388.1 hypothetical protein EO244_00425 [Ancylomarina salipaludis]
MDSSNFKFYYFLRISFLILFLILEIGVLFSQNQAHYIHVSGSQLSIFKKQAKQLARYRFDDEIVLKLKLENLKSYFIKHGYLETNVDRSYKVADTLFAVFHLGKSYVWKDLKLISDKNFAYEGIDFDLDELQSYSINAGMKKQIVILDYCLDHGYPFATLNLSEIKIDDGEISGICNLNLHQAVVWDSMLIRGNVLIHPKFIENYLDIKPGEAYSEEKFEAISGLIDKLEFVSEIKPAELEFFDETAKVYQYLKKQPANRFDGIVGFQKNNKTDKFELTGEVNLALVNSFRRGERIHFNWRKLDESSQHLKIAFEYPYIFNSNFGTDFGFQLLKQDSSYVNTNLRLGLNFQQGANSCLKLYYQSKASKLISTKQFVGLTVLPDFADSKSNFLGFEYDYERFDRQYNPLRGWKLIFDVAGGQNRIRKNRNISDELYKDIELNTRILETSLSLSNYIPLVSKFVYHWQLMGAWMERKNYFENDLFRLGGLKSIRGFNEDAFRASKFAIAKQEIRFVPSRNTSIYLFCDYAWYEREIQSKIVSDRPIGYGFGFNFSTGSGMFSLNYALGRQDGQSVDFKSAKIHFGFISKF